MSQVTEESCMPHVIRTVGFLFITWHLHNKINLRHAWVGLPFHTWAIKVGVFINNEVDQLSSMVIYLFVADVPICTPWNYQKTKGFQVFSEVRKGTSMWFISDWVENFKWNNFQKRQVAALSDQLLHFETSAAFSWMNPSITEGKKVLLIIQNQLNKTKTFL